MRAVQLTQPFFVIPDCRFDAVSTSAGRGVGARGEGVSAINLPDRSHLGPVHCYTVAVLNQNLPARSVGGGFVSTPD